MQNPTQLLILRLLLGLVLGADYVVSKSLVTEHAPRRFRGRLMSLLLVFGFRVGVPESPLWLTPARPGRRRGRDRVPLPRPGVRPVVPCWAA